MTEQAQAAAPVAKVKDEKNGVTRPAAGTITGSVWDAIQNLGRANNGVFPSAAEVIKALPNVPVATVRTQYARFRKYHGIEGRFEDPSKAAKKAAEQAAKDADKAAKKAAADAKKAADKAEKDAKKAADKAAKDAAKAKKAADDAAAKAEADRLKAEKEAAGNDQNAAGA